MSYLFRTDMPVYQWQKNVDLIIISFALSAALILCSQIRLDVLTSNLIFQYPSNFLQLSPSMKKLTKWYVHPAKTQISLGIHPVWSESSLSVWISIGSLATYERTVKTLIRLGKGPGWPKTSLVAHVIVLVLSCFSSIYFENHIDTLAHHFASKTNLSTEWDKKELYMTLSLYHIAIKLH